MADIMITRIGSQCETSIAGSAIQAGDFIELRDNLAYKVSVTFVEGGTFDAIAFNSVAEGEIVIHTPNKRCVLTGEEVKQLFTYMVDMNSFPSDFGNGMTLSKGEYR